jgi:para-aminobenzoate synthetase component I
LRRKFVSFPIADFQQTKMQMLNWGDRFNICCFLDNHEYNSSHHTIECLLAAGSLQSFTSLASVKNDDWIFGHLAYDLKNQVEKLESNNPDEIKFPDVFFYQPQYVVQLTSSEIRIGSVEDDQERIYSEIMNSALQVHHASPLAGGRIKTRFTKEEYLITVEKLRQHILRGDCYEINLCQEFYAENVEISPLQLYSSLSYTSPNPFSAYYKLEDKYALCLSPERYLKKEGTHVISQPIKGTSERSKDPEQDKINKEALQNSEKERAENIMIVDLVRNDLSRICKQGSVHVDELCEIYSFPQVHQMISTVSGELNDDILWSDAVKATFPMGSMTGAPKKRVMELIEEYEVSKRGLFSGSIGYINPTGDFDFNVVIRSVLYNSTGKYLSFQTGSAITFSSEAEKEYEECLLKAAAIKKALAETNTFH